MKGKKEDERDMTKKKRKKKGPRGPTYLQGSIQHIYRVVSKNNKEKHGRRVGDSGKGWGCFG